MCQQTGYTIRKHAEPYHHVSEGRHINLAGCIESASVRYSTATGHDVGTDARNAGPLGILFVRALLPRIERVPVFCLWATVRDLNQQQMDFWPMRKFNKLTQLLLSSL